MTDSKEIFFKTKPLWGKKIFAFAFIVFGIYGLTALLTALGFIGSTYAVADPSLSYAPPSSQHWLGTDLFGRDLFAQNLHAFKTALLVGLFSAGISGAVGLFLGAISGFYGGLCDRCIRWIYTTIDSIPYILLISGLTFVLGQGLSNVYIVLGLTGWVKLCRLIRGEFLKHKEKAYVEAAKALGLSNFRQAFIHILPNCIHIAIVQFGIFFVYAIKIEVVLSFLGLGVEIGTPSWGIMISNARGELPQGIWWNLTAVTLFMFGLILSVNFIVDYFRIALQPRSQKTSSSL